MHLHLRTALLVGSWEKVRVHVWPRWVTCWPIMSYLHPVSLSLPHHTLHYSPPICLSSLSHPLSITPIPISPASHLSLSSSLSSLVHNFTAVIRQSHSFHQRDQELIFLGRGSLDLWAAFPLRLNHVQTLMHVTQKSAWGKSFSPSHPFFPSFLFSVSSLFLFYSYCMGVSSATFSAPLLSYGTVSSERADWE